MPPVKKPKPNKIPKPAKAAAAAPETPDLKKNVVSGQLKKKLPKANPQAKELPQRGVVFIKHLPHGFFEHQLRQYFKQFGHVTRVRLARSERTGGSKGFAFVEFAYPEVAKVAADTMDNYLMFQKVVKASYIPPEQQKFNYFKSSVKKVTNKAGKEIFVSAVTKATQRSVQKMNNWNDTTCQKRTVAGIKKMKKLQQKYDHLGIDFNNLLVEPVKKSKEASASKEATGKAKKSTEKSKKQLKLEDLLGNTINEDSDDEDYVAEDDDDIEEPVSEEDEDDDEEEEEEDEDDEEELPSSPVPKKLQKKKKNTAEDRMADLLKRKPDQGKVQKKKSKLTKKTAAATQLLQLEAAKKVAKPLQKVGKKLKKK